MFSSVGNGHPKKWVGPWSRMPFLVGLSFFVDPPWWPSLCAGASFFESARILSLDILLL
jgi:hypothetical protein